MNGPISPDLRLSELLSVNGIALNLKGTVRDEILRELVHHIPEIAGRPEAQLALLQLLKEREQLHSTGIGDGIALPHARNALGDVLQRPIIVFGRHAQGIAYGSIDGNPVRLFFLMAAVNLTQHLHLLARLSRVLRDKTLRQALLTADQPEQVLQLIREAEARL